MRIGEIDFIGNDDYTVIGEKIRCHSKDASPFYVRYYSTLAENGDLFCDARLHIHKYNELLFFLNSNLAMNINGTIIKPIAGDVVVTRSGEPHCAMILGAGNISYIQIDIPDDAFEGVPDAELFKKCFLSREFCEDNLISPAEEDAVRAMKSALKLISALNTGDHNRMLIYSYVIQFMCIINDIFSKKKSGEIDRILPDNVFKTINYIRDNISEIKSIEQIAAYINVSVSYLCRIFKKHMGYTPYEYLLLQRIEYSKRLMKYHDKNVTEACVESGFNDYSNFISAFKKKVGMTPLEYKNSSQP